MQIDSLCQEGASRLEIARDVLPHLGYISPGHRQTDKTAEILAEAGYIWDADFQERDTATVTEIAGRQMVVMPYAHMSDYMTYPLNGRTPRDLLQLVDEFDVLYAEGVAGRPKMTGCASHPFLCYSFRRSSELLTSEREER